MRLCSHTFEMRVRAWLSHVSLDVWIDGFNDSQMEKSRHLFTKAWLLTSKSCLRGKLCFKGGTLLWCAYKRKKEKKATHILYEQIMKEQNNHITCSTDILWWWDKSYYRKVKQSQPEENITRSAFSLGILQSRSHRYVNQKVAQKKFRWGAN